MGQFLEQPGPEALHEWRVEVKKIAALLKLSCFSQTNKKIKKAFQPIKKMFRKTGEIRQAQLYLDKLEREGLGMSTLTANLNASIEADTKKFVGNGKKHHKLLKKQLKTTTEELSNIPNRHLTRFFRLKIKTISRQLNLGKDRKTYLHEARKNIKEMMYLKHFLIKPEFDLALLNWDYLDKLQKHIGEWHDLNELSDYIEKESHDRALTDKIRYSMAKCLGETLNLAENFQAKIKQAGPLQKQTE